MKRGPGEGSVYQRSDGRWVAEVPVGRGSRAGRERRYLYASSRRDAERKRADAVRALEQGLPLPDARLTVGEHLAGWLVAVRPNVRPSTWVSYEGHVRMHLARLTRIPLVRLTPNDIRAHLRWLLDDGLSPSTVRSALTILRMALRQAVDDGLLARNVAKAVAAPKVEIEDRDASMLTAVQARRLLDQVAGDPLEGVYALALTTGLRQGEILGLRWTDVDLAGRTVNVRRALRPIPASFRAEGEPRLQLVEPKTRHGQRVVALPALTTRLLENHRVRTSAPSSVLGLVFTTSHGTPLDPRNVTRELKSHLEAAGLPIVRFHDLRHAAATLLLSLGVELDEIRAILGHGDLRMTTGYAHVLPETRRRAADALDRALAARRP